MKRFANGALALLCLVCLLLPMGCAKRKEGLIPVELHEVTRSVFYAPQYIAAGLGYFEEEGLDVRITTSGGSDKAMTALLSGDPTYITSYNNARYLILRLERDELLEELVRFYVHNQKEH